jgi:sporulation protein YlmC with PRC-barrel domain
MAFFKNKETEKNNALDSQENQPDADSKIKKKIHIGFGHKSVKESTQNTKQTIQTNDHRELPLCDSQSPEKTNQHDENIDVFLEEVSQRDNAIKEDLLNIETTPENDQLTAKRKAFAQKDMKGKQVYLEDTGEKIGTVFDAVIDAEKNLIGYKVKDNKSDTILSFPLDQFDEDKNGLIFIPSWYMKGLKTIEKLEFKDRITPELNWLIKDNMVSTEELYAIFVKHDDKIANYIEEAVALRELVNNRLKILEKERLSFKEALMDITEKRLINDIDRRKFSEIVMEHRRKVNVVDINIKKCKDLLDRLQHTSFGLLSTTIATMVEKEENHQVNNRTSENWRNNTIQTQYPKEDPYKEKYFELKNRYEKLQEGYNDLKIAVEKLLMKNEL